MQREAAGMATAVPTIRREAKHGMISASLARLQDGTHRCHTRPELDSRHFHAIL